jgi:hypothetical protein
MVKFVFGMNLSLDGFVDHQAFAPDPALFRHWIERVGCLTGSIYGRRMYEVMRYWDEDRPGWRRQPPARPSRHLTPSDGGPKLFAAGCERAEGVSGRGAAGCRGRGGWRLSTTDDPARG